MSRIHSWCGGLLCFAACFVLNACGGTRVDGAQPYPQFAPASLAETAGPAQSPGIDLPFPDDRSAATLTPHDILGKDAVVYSGGGAVQGTTLHLEASLGQIQFGVYRCNTGQHAQQTVHVNLAAVSGQGVYLGRANFHTGHWEFSGPYKQSAMLNIIGTNYVSPLSNVWIAVCIPGGVGVTIDDLSFLIDDPPNLPPTATLSCPTQIANPGDSMLLDASGSHDPDGSIVNYEWDLDGDGAYSQTAAEAAAAGQASVTWTAPDNGGEYRPSVRVTDNAGATASAAVTVTVRGWRLTTVDSNPGGEIETACGLAVVGGFPAILFSSQSNGNEIVQYATCNVADGASGWSSQTITAAGASEHAPALAVVAGCPAYSCGRRLDSSHSDLYYHVAASSVAGAAWSGTVANPKDTAKSVNESSLAEVNGGAAIAYHNGALYYCSEDKTLGWSVASRLVNTYTYGMSLLEVNQCPAIAYRTFNDGTSPGGQRYAYSDKPSGADGSWHTVYVDQAAGAGNDCTLTLVAGCPAIAYYDSTQHLIRYARSPVIDGSSGWTTSTVFNAQTERVWSPSLAIIQGTPALAYYIDDTALVYAPASAADGSGQWSQSQVVPRPVSFGSHVWLQEVDGHTALTFITDPASGAPSLVFAMLYQ